MSNVTIFDILDSLNKKRYLWDEDIEKIYAPYMINRGLSNFGDAVLFASEMNQYPELDKKMQYDFYFHFLPKKDRRGKWQKAEQQSDDEQMLVELFDMSRGKTGQMIRVLDDVIPSWREEAAERLTKGGRARK